jgi:hypothetical protein
MLNLVKAAIILWETIDIWMVMEAKTTVSFLIELKWGDLLAKIILTSNGFSSENIKKKFFEQIDIDKKEIRVAIITTASQHK